MQIKGETLNSVMMPRETNLAGHQPATMMLLSCRPQKDGVNLRFKLQTNRHARVSVSYTLKDIS